VKNNKPRIASTTVLLALIREGNALDLNRQLDHDLVARDIDPDGTHLAVMILPYHQGYDKATPDHHRTEVYIKVKNTSEPVVAFLDMTDDAWDTLETADTMVSI